MGTDEFNAWGTEPCDGLKTQQNSRNSPSCFLHATKSEIGSDRVHGIDHSV